jgi:hypothetical protein
MTAEEIGTGIREWAAQDIRNTFTQMKKGAQWTAEKLRNDPVVRFTKGLLGIGVTDEGQLIEEPANTPAKVPPQKRRENAPSQMRTREQVDRAIANADVPATPAAMQGAATQVLQNKRPGFVELYNAVGLARLGVITSEQLMRYRETGQFNAAAKRNLQVIQSGNVARIFDKDAGVLSPAFFVDPTQGAGGTADMGDILSQRQKYQNLMEDYFQGIEDKAMRQEVINSSGLATQLLGFDPAAMLNDAYRDTMSTAGRLMAGADPDSIQGPWDTLKRVFTPGKTSEGYDFIDLNPLNDPKKYRGGVGLAMTAQMVTNENVSDSKDVSAAMKQYGKFLPSVGAFAGGLTDQQFINLVGEVELEVRKAYPGSTVIIDMPDGSKRSITIKKGNNHPAEQRDQILGELLKAYAGE